MRAPMRTSDKEGVGPTLRADRVPSAFLTFGSNLLADYLEAVWGGGGGGFS